MSNLITEAVIDIAHSQRGVMEQGGNNRGKMVEEYQRAVDLEPGSSWCAAFVRWCLDRGGEKVGRKLEFIRTGYCPTIHQWAKDRGILREMPMAGDVFLRIGYVPAEGIIRAHHTGFVREINGAVFGTIEGNSNEQGSSDGYEVAENKRTNGISFRFVRWGDLIEAPAEAWLVKGPDGSIWFSLNPIGGRIMVPVRIWGARMGFKTEWDQAGQQVLFNGQELPAEIISSDGRAYAHITDLIENAGLKYIIDSQARTLQIAR